MSGATTHDFYLGRGPDAEWLGSVHLGSGVHSGLDEIEQARTAGGFAMLTDVFLSTTEADEAGVVAHRGGDWLWLWPTSHGTDYVYAFDDGVVWTARRGERWSQRAGAYLPPMPDQAALVFPHGRATCGYTGIDAADTTARRYGPLLGATHHHDLYQLSLRILTDLTEPAGPGTPGALDELRAPLPPHLRYAVTADEAAAELELEVFGYRDGDLASEETAHALSLLPALYGWTDPAGGPPRFGVRVLIADDNRHTTHPVLADVRARAVLTATDPTFPQGEDTMSPNTAPADPAAPDEAEAGEPRSAAEHVTAAEGLFTRAREMYPTLGSRAADQDDYRRCLDWARLHLRLAEAITAGAGLVLAHRQLLAGDVRLHNTYVSSEASQWTEFLGNHHDMARRSA